MPMKHFTFEEAQPAKKTLDLIRTIAYTYRVMNLNGKTKAYCLNKKIKNSRRNKRNYYSQDGYNGISIITFCGLP